MTPRDVVAPVLGALALAACALLPRPQAPEIVGATVRIVEVRLPTIRFDVALELQNPNRFDVSVAAVDADLAIAGERAGSARLAAPVTLVAGGTSSVTIEATGDASIALAGLGRALGGARQLDYELRGAIVLADGARFPFAKRGQVAPGGGRP